MKTEDLIIRTDVEIISEADKRIKKLLNNEYHLRRKCKRYRKYVKGLLKGIKWRNEVITELATQLGYVDGNTISFSNADFQLLLDFMEAVPEPNLDMKDLFKKQKWGNNDR
jgi:hypothetical protein